MKYKIGDKVECNGNHNSYVIGVYDYYLKIYIVRLWSGFRHVGDTIASENDLNFYKQQELA
jgi:hypothetical protein